MHSSALGTIDRTVLRSLLRAALFSLLKGARYSSMVFGRAVIRIAFSMLRRRLWSRDPSWMTASSPNRSRANAWPGCLPSGWPSRIVRRRRNDSFRPKRPRQSLRLCRDCSGVGASQSAISAAAVARARQNSENSVQKLHHGRQFQAVV